MMMITFMEVKGCQRSNVVNYALWLPNFVRRISDASFRMMVMSIMEVNGQMGPNMLNYVPWLQTSEVKNLYYIATTFGQMYR